MRTSSRQSHLLQQHIQRHAVWQTRFSLHVQCYVLVCICDGHKAVRTLVSTYKVNQPHFLFNGNTINSQYSYNKYYVNSFTIIRAVRKVLQPYLPAAVRCLNQCVVQKFVSRPQTNYVTSLSKITKLILHHVL